MIRYIVTTENRGSFAASSKKKAIELLKLFGSNNDNSLAKENIYTIEEFLKITLENYDCEEIIGL